MSANNPRVNGLPEPAEQIRTERPAFELRIEASAQRTFEVMTLQSLDWSPVTYGEDRVRRVVLEPRVGGQHYEDSVTKVATGPMTEEEAGIARFGDLTGYAPAIQKLAAS